MPNIGNVVCAIIERNGKFLIAQRPSTHQLAGSWEFPGGKVSNGESHRDALKREIHEELNVMIEVHSPLTPIEHSYPHLSLTLIPYICTITSGTPKAIEHQQLNWITVDSVNEYTFAEADIPILNEYISQKRSK